MITNTQKQEQIKNRKIAVIDTYNSIGKNQAVTPIVNQLAKKFKVSSVTIFNDIKAYKTKVKAMEYKFDTESTPIEWFALCNEYAKSIGYCTSGYIEDYQDAYDDQLTPYETINEDLIAGQ